MHSKISQIYDHLVHCHQDYNIGTSVYGMIMKHLFMQGVQKCAQQLMYYFHIQMISVENKLF